MRRFLELTISTLLLGLVSVIVQAQPVISGFSPQFGPAGTVVTITGSNFSTTPTLNSVYFGHIKATVDSCYANLIYVRVPFGAQYKKITVTTGGKTAWTKYPFKFQNPCAPGLYNNSFKAPIRSTGALFHPKPTHAIIGDFDKDAKPDIAMLSHSGGGTSRVTVCRNMGTPGAVIDSGTFFPYTARTGFPVAGSTASSIAVCDFDCDGSQDIITAALSSPSVSILRNTGSSGNVNFAAFVPINTSPQPNYATGADLDGDGKPEIVLVTGGSTSLLNVLRNNTTPGTILSSSFVSPTTYALAGSQGAAYLDFDDIDGDGKLDIAVACSTGGVISIFRNTSVVGTVSFAARVDIVTGNFPYCVRLMDMDGDNKPDIVCSRVKTPLAGPNTPTPGPDSLYNIHRNLITVPGSITIGSFASPVSYALRANPLIFDLADFDGDQRPDIAAPNYLSSSIYVWRNQSTSGTVNMTPRLNEIISGMTNPTSVAVGDLNADNIPDMVIINQPTTATAPGFFTIIEGQKPKAVISNLTGVPTCPGNTVKVAVTASGAPYLGGNVFSVVMSDSLGSFASPVVVGTKAATGSDTIVITIPADAKPGGLYRLLINTTSPSVSCVDTGYPIQIITPPVANAGTDTTVNIGDSVRLNATGTAVYNWNSSIYLGDTTVGNPYARPYYTTDFVVAGVDGNCRGYDTVRVTVTQNINSCNNCSPEYPMNNKLVGCYPFNGSAIDLSGNSNHLSFQNTPGTQDRSFAATSAYSFNGVDAWMTRPSMLTDANDSVTLMCWAWQTLNSQNVPLIFFGVDSGSTASGYGLYMDGGTSGSPGNNISVRAGATSLSNASTKLQFQQWTHVALVKAGSSYSVYVDGSLGFTQTGTSGSIASGILMIGGSPYRNASLLGKMDDVKIFERALSATEIQQFYANNYKRFVKTGSDTTMCQGDSVRLTANGANTYSWNYFTIPGGGATSTINSPTSVNPWVYPVTAPGGNKAVYYVVTGTKTYCSDKDTVILSVDNYKNFADAGNNSGFCLGDSIQLGGSGCVTYQWSPNLDIDDANSPIPYVHPSTTTDYVLKGTFGKCVDYDTVNVRVDNFANFVNAGNDTTICAGNAVSLNASGADGYEWTPNTVSNRYIANPTDAPTTTTTYYLKSNKGYCYDYDTVVIFVDQFANFLTLSYHDTSLCTGLSAYPFASGATQYKWTPAAGISDDTLPNPVITPAANITYTVTGRKGACVEKDSIKVNVDDYHNFLTASGDTTMCPGEFRPLFASGADSYSWYPSTPDMITSPVIPNPYASPQSTTTYYVAGSIGSCVELDSVKITVGANSSATVDAGDDRKLCLGDTVHLNAKGVGAFTWSPEIGLSDPNIPNPVASPVTTTQYVLTIVDINGVACKIFDTLTITVNTKPTARITDPHPDSAFYCRGATVNLKADIGTGYTYFWTATDTAEANIKSPISRTTPAVPTLSMMFTVRVYEISTQCEAFDSIFINVIDPPVVDLGPDIAICKTDSVVLAPVKIENAIAPTYKWTVIYDTLNLVYTTASIKVSPYKKANVYLRLSEGKCISKVDTMNITVAPKVVAYFSTDPERGPSPLFVTLTNGSIGADEFFWDFGDTLGIIGRQRDTIYSYNDTGYYRIILKARNSIGGCFDYDTAWVRVDDIVTFFVPSAFSPNGDGTNDRFEVNETGVAHYKGSVYNKWGQLMYSVDTKDSKFSWDGRFNGEMVPTDIYYYVFDYTTFGDKQDSRSGTIYLSR